MAKAKRARRNSFRTMSGDGALEALDMIERVAGVDEQSESDDDAAPEKTPAEPPEDED